ncbi:acyl-[acyl-carrier-protein] thioesterase [Haloimpatiens sp. FM7330]|uniref:acyl-[acyl-carrier-protein] thioesterase n=1 Tax=Haloimpatiens sp. FM7330 TaxID=3298610 RepID=UPI0036448035
MLSVVTEKYYNIHYYEIDYKNRVLITNLMNYFSDIAIQQIQDINMGLDFLKEKKIAWVLYKWDIKIHRYPLYNEKIKVRTWAYGLKKFYAYRKYEIVDSNGEIIAEADSIWLLINIEKRKPIRIPDFMYDAFNISKVEQKSLKISKIKKLDRIDTEARFNVRYSDIDTNKHVNNVKYVAWAIETVPKDIVLKYELKRVKVKYVKEVEYGVVVKVRTQIIEKENEVICIHKIQDKNENELTVLQTEWR